MSAETNGRPEPFLSPADEVALRRRKLLQLAALLVVGFLLPVMRPASHRRGAPSKLVFESCERLFGRGVSPVARLDAGYPLLAAAVVAALAASGARSGRGVVMIAVAVWPGVLIMAMPQTDRLFAAAMDSLGGLVVLCLAFSLLAWVGLLVGARSQWHRPDSVAAGAIALIGGILQLAAVVLQVRVVLSLGPEWQRAGDGRGLPWEMILAAAAALCMTAAAVLCIASVWNKLPSKRRRAAATAFGLFVAGACGSAVAVMAFVLGAADASERTAAFLSLAKAYALGVGLLLVLTMGLTEIVIGAPRSPR